MFKFIYETEDFQSHFNLPKGSLFTTDCIVDVELMNDISPKWIYAEGKPCVVGIIHEGIITICVAETEKDVEFEIACWHILCAKAKATRLYAFNFLFELRVLKSLFDGFEFPIEEVRSVIKAGWTKDKCYEMLRENDVITGDKPIIDKYGGDGRLAVKDWQAWLKTEDRQHLMNIVEHNINCLLKEALILKNAEWFKLQYGVK